MVLTRHNRSHRLELIVRCGTWAFLAWATFRLGEGETIVIEPGKTYEREVKVDLGLYRGKAEVELSYREYGYVGALGRASVTVHYLGSPPSGEIGFFKRCCLMREVAEVCRELGYEVTYVDESDYRSVRLLILDYYDFPEDKEGELLEFVRGGGRVLVLGLPGEWVWLKEPRVFLGAEISLSSVTYRGKEPWRLGIATHPVTRGIEKVVYLGGAYIRPPARAVTLMTIDGRPILAVEKLGEGKVAWIICEWMFGRYGISEADHKNLLVNLVSWLMKN